MQSQRKTRQVVELTGSVSAGEDGYHTINPLLQRFEDDAHFSAMFKAGPSTIDDSSSQAEGSLREFKIPLYLTAGVGQNA